VAGVNAAATFSVFVSNDGADGVIEGDIDAADATALGINALSVDTDANAAAAVAALSDAVTALGSVQAQVGTIENPLPYAISLASSQIVNNQAAESRIRDANIAQESSNLTKYNILQQSGIAALAQANASTANVLALLR